MADTSAKPILVAGAVGTVILLGVAWMFAASASRQAVVNAEEYAASRQPVIEANFDAKVESDDDLSKDNLMGDLPNDTEAAEAEEAKPEETEAAEAEEAKSEETEAAEAEEAKSEETEAAEAEEAKPEETEAAEAEEVKPEETEAAEAEEAKPEETETAEAEEAKPEETEAAEAEEAKPEETEAAEAEEPETAEAEAPAETEMAAITGDAKKGAKVYRKCKACHQIGEGASNKVGPMLTDVVGRTMGTVEGFEYSAAFKTAMEEGRTWTPEELDAFLAKPRKYMKGTKMAFAGVRKDDQREDLIAYLASNGE